MTFITNRIQLQSLDRSPDPNSSSSAPVSVVSEADSFSEYGKDKASSLPFIDGLTDGVRRNGFGHGYRMNSLQIVKENAECQRDSAAPFCSEVKEPTGDDDRISKASNKTMMFPKSVCNQLSSYFTPKDLNSCIISSENTLVLCSIMIAILVAIAYPNLPRHVVRSKSIIASRPLCLLLATDFIIVILWRCFTKQNPPKVEAEKASSRQEDGSNWDEAVKFPDRGG